MYIAINTERTINCSVVGGPFNFWRVIFRNSTPERGFTIGQLVPGIAIASEASALSSLIVNTTDTSIIGLECNGGFSNEDVTTRINLTIYGMLIKEPNNELDLYHVCQLWKTGTQDMLERIYLEFFLQVVWIA